jgi:para-nitrobenzyl esterase
MKIISAIAFCYLCALATAARVIVKAPAGTFVGQDSKGGASFLGIPYALPPVGPRRFSAPIPQPPLSSSFDASAFPPMCPQPFLEVGRLQPMQEDCLFLNVFTPAVPSQGMAEPLGVMVFFYGGSFVIGDSWEFGFYEGSALAATANRVIVTLNYRLGPLGFFALDELEDEDHRAVGNYGMMDQRLALLWVRENIASFGGDPNRVTIFGESAGAFSVCYHLVSPASASLFHAAIMESGSCDALIFYNPTSIAKNYSQTFASSLGCSGPDVLPCMRSADLRRLQHHWPNGTTRESVPPLAPLFPWGPTIRNSASVELPDIPLRLITRGKFNRVPVIAGTNQDEGTLFSIALHFVVGGNFWPPTMQQLHDALMRLTNNATSTAAVLQEYSSDIEVSIGNATATIITDAVFACGTRRLLQAISSHNVTTHMYQFIEATPWIDTRVLGDYHTAELSYLFGSWSVVHPLTHERLQLAEYMRKAWASVPQEWQPFNTDHGEVATSHFHINLFVTF